MTPVSLAVGGEIELGAMHDGLLLILLRHSGPKSVVSGRCYVL